MTATALSIVHKILKKDMFDMCQMIYCAAPEDGPEIARRLLELSHFLEQHAAHENERFAPIMAQSDPGAAAAMQAEHEEQERALRKLQERVQAISTDPSRGEDMLHDVGLDWTRFVGEMLLHLDREERAWRNALAPAMEGVEAIGTVAANQPPELQDGFLSKVWPVATPGERRRIDSAYRTARDKSLE